MTDTNMRFAQADTRFSLIVEGGSTTVAVSLVNHLKFGVPGMLMDPLAVRSIYCKGMRALLQGLR